jgi:hypothetical protein
MTVCKLSGRNAFEPRYLVKPSVLRHPAERRPDTSEVASCASVETPHGLTDKAQSVAPASSRPSRRSSSLIVPTRPCPRFTALLIRSQGVVERRPRTNELFSI